MKAKSILAFLVVGMALVAGFSGCVGSKPEVKKQEAIAPKPDNVPLASFEYRMTDDGLVVDASKSKDAAGLPLRYIWHWGDGTNGTGVKTLHSYEADGTYIIELCVDSGSGVIGIAKVTIDTKAKELNGSCDSSSWAVADATPVANKWAIVEGDNYPGTGSDLPDCHLDALNVYDYLVKSCGFPTDHIFLFLNQTACPMNIKAAANYIAQNSNESSEFVYYHSGHGGAVPLSGETGVVESAIYVSTDSWNDLYGLTTSELKEMFAGIKSKKFAFISDSCQTGEMGGIGDSKTVPLTEGIASEGRIVITASNEATVSSSTGNGGVFTIAFLTQGLREGKGDGCSELEPPALAGTLNAKDGQVSLQEAYWYAFYTLETGGGADATGVEHMPEMTDNYGEPFFL